MIPGGYYLKARKSQSSWIAHAPPHVRETWDWLIANANRKPQLLGGKVIERGQIFTSYSNIIEGLHWMVGYRRITYTKGDIETCMKTLTKHTMITTTKTTRGMIVTICNYDYYQNPKNYETYNETEMITTTKPTREPQRNLHENHTILEEGRSKNKEVKKKQIVSDFVLPEWIDPQTWADFKIHRTAMKAPMTPGAIKKTISDLIKLKDKGQDPNDVLLQSMGRGWKGVFEVKQEIILGNGTCGQTAFTKQGLRNVQVAKDYLKMRGVECKTSSDLPKN